MGEWLYAVIFIIVFCETGLVVTPFLPGDSLLFALGSMTMLDGSQIDFTTLSFLLIGATLAGDNVNYFIGKKIGPRIFNNQSSKIFNPKYLNQTNEFYIKHGKKAVIMARFVPIVRTFVPFIAGIGRMPYFQYLGFSLVGSLLWTQGFLWAGRLFGEMEFVKRNFQLVIIAVIVVSILPAIITWYRRRRSPVE